ncbi:hypothetical protein KC887_04385 [Candidatus Kaiserbacteria bacterium]|nr:hypothetical protein [Candidatus Kaiserbacteria bacterium]
MTVICNYPSKKFMQDRLAELTAAGEKMPFDGYDPSIFGNSAIQPNGRFAVCNRPQIDGRGMRLARQFDLRTSTGKLKAPREFFATVVLDADMNIKSVK